MKANGPGLDERSLPRLIGPWPTSSAIRSLILASTAKLAARWFHDFRTRSTSISSLTTWSFWRSCTVDGFRIVGNRGAEG
jgi:hypothetical protein